MFFPFRGAVISTFAHATEDERKVFVALQLLLPGGVEVRRVKLKGHHGNPIISFEAAVGQRKLLRELWQRVIEKLRAGELEKLSATASDRMDETCRLHLRFDKQLAHAGELVLSESGDAIHLRIKVAAYPAKPEVAVDLVKKFVRGQSQRPT